MIPWKASFLHQAISMLIWGTLKLPSLLDAAEESFSKRLWSTHLTLRFKSVSFSYRSSWESLPWIIRWERCRCMLLKARKKQRIVVKSTQFFYGGWCARPYRHRRGAVSFTRHWLQVESLYISRNIYIMCVFTFLCIWEGDKGVRPPWHLPPGRAKSSTISTTTKRRRRPSRP